jgi:hypothetical protein
MRTGPKRMRRGGGERGRRSKRSERMDMRKGSSDKTELRLA